MTQPSYDETLTDLFASTVAVSTLAWCAADLHPEPEWEKPEVDPSGWCLLDGVGMGEHV